MAESDLVKLYSGKILELAADIPHLGSLEAPHASVRHRSPLCGSTVKVDLKLKDGRIAEFAQDVKACALGQAAASVLGRVAIGLDEETLARGAQELREMLKNGGPVPGAPFEGFEVLLPARDFRNRHASIMLAMEATLEALRTARKSACA